MRRKVKYKNLISLALVLILLIALCVPSSFAIDTGKRRFGAMVLSALQAINIYCTATLAPAQSMLDAIADPPGLEGTYTYPWEPTWDDDYLNRSSIQIWPDYTEIDGVRYSDVWLSHDAAEKFRVNAFDWKTAYSITSESNGTFVSGTGFIDGMPMFQDQVPLNLTQAYTIPSFGTYSMGNAFIKCGPYRDTGWTEGKWSFQSDYAGGIGIGPPTKARAGYNGSNDSGFMQVYYPANNSWYTINNIPNFRSYGVLDTTPFDFDYVAGEIPADQVLPSDTGMMIRVPSDTTGLQTFITNNIDFTNEGGVNLDFDLHPELQIAVDDLLDILAPVIPVVNTGDIQFTVNHEAPIPPIPDTPIIDATVPQVVQPIINEIQNQGDIISQSIPPIIESIPKIDEICNNIDTAPYHDLDTGLDHLPSFFLPFITDLRSALGIWHYVTEWLAQISTTFAFVTGCLVGTSIMTPIYAAIAGIMCIKIYRRMTA